MRLTGRSEVATRSGLFARAVASLVAALGLLLTACQSGQAHSEARDDELVVFAASSLRDVFTELGRQFEQDHPGLELTLHFAGTQELRSQLEHGAAADVFASADPHHMEELVQRERVLAPVVFAHGELVVVVASESRAAIRSFRDLPRAARIVVGSSEVPIGRYTARVLERATALLGSDFRSRVEQHVISRELNVRQVLTKVRLGEAQAGIVYRSDATLAPEGVAVVSIPRELNVVAEYPIAVVADAPHPELARAWVALVLSERGQAALRRAGFFAPPRE